MRQYNYQVLDNIISQEEADYYEMLTLGRCNGRYMLPVINYKPKWEPTAKGESESIPLSFWHPLKDDLVTGSEHLEIFLSPLIEFCKIKSFPLRELLNARIFITQPLDDKERKKFCKTYSKGVSVGKSTIIGPFSVILPGAEIGDFCTLGPYSCIYKKINSGYYLYNTSIKKNLLKKRNLSKLKKDYEKYFKNY